MSFLPLTNILTLLLAEGVLVGVVKLLRVASVVALVAAVSPSSVSLSYIALSPLALAPSLLLLLLLLASISAFATSLLLVSSSSLVLSASSYLSRSKAIIFRYTRILLS